MVADRIYPVEADDRDSVVSVKPILRTMWTIIKVIDHHLPDLVYYDRKKGFRIGAKPHRLQ